MVRLRPAGRATENNFSLANDFACILSLAMLNIVPRMSEWKEKQWRKSRLEKAFPCQHQQEGEGSANTLGQKWKSETHSTPSTMSKRAPSGISLLTTPALAKNSRCGKTVMKLRYGEPPDEPVKFRRKSLQALAVNLASWWFARPPLFLLVSP